MRAYAEIANNDSNFTTPFLGPDQRMKQIATLLVRGVHRLREARLTAAENLANSGPTCLEQSPPALLTVMDG